jgi:SAM-dependent methyltransferase
MSITGNTVGTRAGWREFWRIAADQNAVWEYACSLVRGTAEQADVAFDDTRILDIACGERQVAVGSRWQKAALRVGLDLDADALASNRELDLAVRGDIHALPFNDGSFNRIVSVDTLEHSDRPQMFLAELDRVLVPGGKVLIFTPHLWGYKTLISRVGGPFVFKLVWKIFNRRTIAYDAFYRANTASSLRRQLQATSLRLKGVYYIAELPHFFYRSRVLSLAAYAHNRFVLAVGLPWLLTYMMAVLEKDDSR